MPDILPAQQQPPAGSQLQHLMYWYASSVGEGHNWTVGRILVVGVGSLVVGRNLFGAEVGTLVEADTRL